MTASETVQRARSRGDDLVVRVLESAVEILGQVGYSRLTIDVLARRSRVAKTTIYRRWANKDDLLVDVIGLLWSGSRVAQTAGLEEDLERIIASTLRTFRGPQGRAKVSVYAESLHNPELADAWTTKVKQPFESELRAVLERGLHAGRLSPGTYVDETVAMLAGVALYYALFDKEPLRSGFAARAVATVLHPNDHDHH